MRVLCCESCSSGQRLAAPTERERKKGNKRKREMSEQRWQPSTEGPEEELLIHKVLLRFQNYVFSRVKQGNV